LLARLILEADGETEPSRLCLTIQLINELLFHECGTRRWVVYDADPFHELEGRERVSADAGRYPFWRIAVAQNDFRIVRVEPGFEKPSPAQIDVRIEKQPYQSRIERSEYFPPIQRDRGPVLVNNMDEVGIMSGLYAVDREETQT